METKNVEIAVVGLCSEKAVSRAVERGLLDTGDLESVIEWVMRMRIKKIGFMKWADALVDPEELPEGVQKGLIATETSNDLGYEPDYDQTEGEW